MKRIVWAALAVATLSAATCLVLLAGNDDISQFRRMRRM
jgi:hypothetical protein